MSSFALSVAPAHAGPAATKSHNSSWRCGNPQASRTPDRSRRNQSARKWIANQHQLPSNGPRNGHKRFSRRPGTRQATRCARQSCRMHTGTLCCPGHVRSAINDRRVAGEDWLALNGIRATSADYQNQLPVSRKSIARNQPEAIVLGGRRGARSGLRHRSLQ